MFEKDKAKSEEATDAQWLKCSLSERSLNGLGCLVRSEL